MLADVGALIRTRARRFRRAVKFAFSTDEEPSPKALKPKRRKAAGSDFYETKPTTMPRFIYRRLAHELTNVDDGERRRRSIETFKRTIEEAGNRGEFAKFKWCLPRFLADLLTPDERGDMESWLAARREGRNRRYVEGFPACADEFDVGVDFLDSVFAIPVTDAIRPETRVFTIGSCFARNIADFLAARGYNAKAFFQTEDLNSPLSNALMLAVATLEPEEREGYLRTWLGRLYAPANEAELASLIEDAVERLDRLRSELQAAAVVIVTIGNTLDFFIDDAVEPGVAAGPMRVAPKFLLLSELSEVAKRTALAAQLKAQGARFRMASLPEARAAIASLHDAIRKINPGALCIFTLSPVPIDSAIGLEQDSSYGSIEIDCVSKSTLRVALHELMGEWATKNVATRYFPSYEIVRWIGPMLPEPTFGAEDAAARHVSNTILHGVYAYFLQKFGGTREPHSVSTSPTG